MKFSPEMLNSDAADGPAPMRPLQSLLRTIAMRLAMSRFSDPSSPLTCEGSARASMVSLSKSFAALPRLLLSDLSQIMR